MSRPFAAWATESLTRTVLCAVVAAAFGTVPFFVWAPGALVVMLSLVDAPIRAGAAAWLVGALVAAAWATQIDVVPAVLIGAGLVVPSYVVGRLLARGATVSIVFQFATVAVLATLVVIYVLINDPADVWKPVVTEMLQALRQAASTLSNATAGPRLDDERIVAESAARLWGAAGWAYLLVTMVAALLGQYWASGKTGQRTPGSSFSALAAGKTLAGAFVACVLGALLVKSAFCIDALVVFNGVFVLQGLSILHTMLLSSGLSGFALATTYAVGFVTLLLVGVALPVVVLAVESGLFIAGFIDNWFPLRPRILAAGRRRS